MSIEHYPSFLPVRAIQAEYARYPQLDTEMVTTESRRFAMRMGDLINAINIYGETEISPEFRIQKENPDSLLRLWFTSDMINGECSVTIEKNSDVHDDTYRIFFMREDLSKKDYYEITDYTFSADTGEYRKKVTIYDPHGFLENDSTMASGDFEIVGSALLIAEQKVREYIDK